jgi:hypothetical protein
MTRTRRRAAAAAIAVACTGAAIVAAAPAWAAPAGQTISFTEHTTSDHTFNLGPGQGFAVGSVELFADNLTHDGKKIGHDGGSFTVVRLGTKSADQVCSLTVVLAHGQIDLAGLVTDTKKGPGTFQLAITGGTGRYQSARGYATIVPTDSPKVTVHISA